MAGCVLSQARYTSLRPMHYCYTNVAVTTATRLLCDRRATSVRPCDRATLVRRRMTVARQKLMQAVYLYAQLKQ